MNKAKQGFSFNTITSFDEHIKRSIPNYEILFGSIVRLSDYFKDESKVIYDLGCSTGNLLMHLADNEGYKGRMVGIDASRHLLPQNSERYPTIEFVEHDLNKLYQIRNACIVYSIFTAQFIKRENRLRLIESVYEGLDDGGAFFLAEKTYTEDGIFQDMFTFSYFDYKKANFTEKEILDKERDLRTILKPNYPAENLAMLREAGFKKIAMFFKYFQFEGYLCIK